jgi:alpha-galactosidase
MAAALSRRAVLVVCLALTAAVLPPPPARALDNGLARTPPMGWNSWFSYHCGVTEQGVRANAQALVDSGLAARGYRYVNVDGCWEARTRTSGGSLRADPTTFPSGMAALGRSLHAMGLKFGIYTSAGPTICLHPQPGSYRHYRQDFRTFAAWKVDYVKVDWCSSPPKVTQMKAYGAIARAAAGAGRRMIVTVSTTGTRKPWRWAHRYGNTWRIANDANGTWAGVLAALDADAPLWPYAGPGRWNDPDMLQVGSQALTDTEGRAQLSLWSMLAAPLLEGYDLSTASAATFDTLGNPDVIAVDQDRRGRQGRRVRTAARVETWMRPLAGGSWAVLFLNRGEGPRQLSVRVDRIPGIPAAPRYSLRDLWAHTDREIAAGDAQQVDLAPHEAVMWRVVPAGG